MNSVIQIQYKKYSEGVIVTDQNVDEVLDHLLSDKDIVDYHVEVEGEIDLESALGKSDLACNISSALGSAELV